MALSARKQNRLRRLANDRGVIAALAVDHRGPLEAEMARLKRAEVTRNEIAEFKATVASVLSRYFSAVLLDPEYSLVAVGGVASGTGILLAYEQSGDDNSRPGRRASLLPQWSVRRLAEAGADGIKLLLHYTPEEQEEINREKKALVERVGAECAAAGLPFLLELITYRAPGSTDDEFLHARPGLIAAAVREFNADRYGADVLKVEIPVDMNYVQGSSSRLGCALWTRRQAREAFRLAFADAAKPLVFLSAGVSQDLFVESLRLARESGIRWSGIACGRALWQQGIPAYLRDGRSALETWLSKEGRARARRLDRLLRAATPWHQVSAAGQRRSSPVGPVARLRTHASGRPR